MESKMTPKDFFLHLAAMSTLYFGVGALIWLLFTVIDYQFQTGLYRMYNMYNYGGSHPISWPVSFLIVLTPLYLFLNWLIIRGFTRDVSRRDQKIYKWLVFLTLFVTAAIIVGDLIAVLYRFLDGQIISASFIFKVLALLAVSAGVFSYYLLELKEKITKSSRHIFMTVAVLAILLSIGAGFIITGSPMTQRLRRADSIRVQHLNEIQWQIMSYWQSRGVLPRVLTDLNDSISGFAVPQDPVGLKDYEYAIIGPAKFKLCATFALARGEGEIPNTTWQKPLTRESGPEDNWRHSSGYVCFERKIDIARYPVQPIKIR